jgi:hypothetical protein
VTVTREIEGDEGALQSESDRVESVRVLRTTVNQDKLGLADPPAQATQLTKSVDGDEESLDRRGSDMQVPLVNVLVKK